MTDKTTDVDAITQNLIACLADADLSTTPPAADIVSDESDLFADVMADADAAAAESDAFLSSGN
ncbi:hypothetical protein ACOI1H_13555 [Loktanella sp. DJP18]|uniref:hypothetical protein n=1 Tax=Loktanella sp. DJP18 TaxID=3409788 RepID=UPI003BB5E3FC